MVWHVVMYVHSFFVFFSGIGCCHYYLYCYFYWLFHPILNAFMPGNYYIPGPILNAFTYTWHATRYHGFDWFKYTKHNMGTFHTHCSVVKLKLQHISYNNITLYYILYFNFNFNLRTLLLFLSCLALQNALSSNGTSILVGGERNPEFSHLGVKPLTFLRWKTTNYGNIPWLSHAVWGRVFSHSVFPFQTLAGISHWGTNFSRVSMNWWMPWRIVSSGWALGISNLEGMDGMDGPERHG